MDAIIELLQQLDYAGMAIASFVAGSFFPFSSEVILVAFLKTGSEPWPLFLSATIGNVMGSMFNYWVGSMGRLEWVEKYLHVKREKLEKTQRWLQGRGAWMGFFCFIPVLGSALSVALGYMRANPYISFLSIFLGKSLRYAALIWITSLV